MKTSTAKKAAANRRLGRSDPAVDGVFDAYPKPVKAKLLALRRLILDTAKATQGVGELEETLKWGSRAISRPRARAAARTTAAIAPSCLMLRTDFPMPNCATVGLALTYHLGKRKAK